MWFFALLGCNFEAAPAPGDTAEVVFDVPSGSTARGLADELEDDGLVTSADNWGWFLRLGADGSCLKAGKHRVNRGMTAPELLAALCGVPVADDIPFTVVEGWRRRDIDAALAAQKLIEPGEFVAATEKGSDYSPGFPIPAGSLEGYLFPDTYKVEPDRFDVHTFVERQLHAFGQRFAVAAEGEHGTRPVADVVIVASMIEREEPSKANRPLVAGIMWKRLDANWNLGIDATSRYTLEDWNNEPAFLHQLFDATDRYNTRVRGGLPPTPIGNPGIESLNAAMHPEATEYWYYLHDASGMIHPSRTVKEHDALKRKWLH
ncbi:aminodeoxychorismate lyase [Deltaproteobacteria bacterium]|nr:aminodeoxychorismate lyase [Deltaproteobacteria bacterium]